MEPSAPVGRPRSNLGPSKITTVAIKLSIHKKLKLAIPVLEKTQTEIINEALAEYFRARKDKFPKMPAREAS